MAVEVAVAAAKGFAERINAREARVGIVGPGYARLPLARACAEAGFDVVGTDLGVEQPHRREARLVVDTRNVVDAGQSVWRI